MSRFFNLLVTVAILGAVFYACKSKSDPAPGPVDPMNTTVIKSNTYITDMIREAIN